MQLGFYMITNCEPSYIPKKSSIPVISKYRLYSAWVQSEAHRIYPLAKTFNFAHIYISVTSSSRGSKPTLNAIYVCIYMTISDTTKSWILGKIITPFLFL